MITVIVANSKLAICSKKNTKQNNTKKTDYAVDYYEDDCKSFHFDWTAIFI